MSRKLRVRLVVSAVVGIAGAALLAVISPTGPAEAHGNVIGPASRNYGCYQRWGSKFQDPAMATEDPMCWQAWQADPNAMWNWNGLFREGVAGNHQAAIPDGTLCSAGHTQSGRYNAMDTVGDWKATSVGNSFSVRLFDQASHGADYIRVYVTKPSFNPVTTAPKWSDLELVSQIGNTPAAQWQQATGGVQIDVPVALSGRTGRALVYTIWQASHLDQSYYFCSDIAFGGTGTTPPTTTPPTTTPPTTPPTTTPPAGTAACSATYAVTSQWQGGYQADVTVTAGSAAIKSWQVTLGYGSTQSVTQSWNSTVTASGSTLTAKNASYNGALAGSGRTTFGFIANGTAGTPTVTCSATT
ncbi:lytic polysaccharide monooxygenase [Actinoplanes sp. N902-109]|uniref:lytic polysaccharide monooxygenase auxiliary activity family 9 protein n=1 Tax=Actinoplanes sp. (strain N902-109) TaxID=649831 RepID=UPI00032942DA|nr:lytic polysaccharide monooxygenase [Actinoplanes sp. N902-109]AGL17244.1 chitin-binding domain 3 protein [Actinoplanes sp. N902-109]